MSLEEAIDQATTVSDPMQPMSYIDTDEPAKLAAFKAVNLGAQACYDIILQNCPQSAERTLAIRKLQEARMWANAAIVFDGRRYPT
jgi:cytosine/adenosine deaminase-related metal-dependent hydrolase